MQEIEGPWGCCFDGRLNGSLMGTNWSAEAALAAGGAADDVSQLMAHSAPHDVRLRRPSEYALAVHEIKHKPS